MLAFVIIALGVASLALVLIGVVAYRVREIVAGMAEYRRTVARAVAKVSNNARRVDDRLTYYERRPDGLKSLRAGYDKQIAKKRASLAEADDTQDAAPEGTAQAERLIG